MKPDHYNPATRTGRDRPRRSPHRIPIVTLISSPQSNNLLDLVYHDDELLVVNKPPGLLAVPGRGADKQDCLATRIQQEYPDALVVHRLDMATSGLMMFGRGGEVQRRLSQMFLRREIQKRYVAVVVGELEPAEGEVNLPIVADWARRPLRKIDFVSGKPSLTRFRMLEHDTESGTSRVELEPVTGRTHQLRLHMSAIGHAVLGDAWYANVEAAGSERLLLHARCLTFRHPTSGKFLAILSEPTF